MGRYPVDAVAMLAAIAAAIEPHRKGSPIHDELTSCNYEESVGLPDVIALSVETTLQRVTPVTVIVPTRGGATARRISRFRLPVWITAVSSAPKTCQDLVFSYGVFPHHETDHPTDWRAWIQGWFKSQNLDGSLVVMTEGPSRKHPERNNRMEVIDLKVTSPPKPKRED